MPTTPPDQPTATKRDRSPGGSRKLLRWRPWLPLGPAVAGVALSLGFHLTLRLWEQTKSYEPLDLSPPFAAKPLPGTSLDSLIRRHGSQLPLLLNPATQPDGFAPPPPLLIPDVAAADAARQRQPSQPATLDDKEDEPAQDQTTLVVPQLPRPILPTPTPVEPGAPEPTIPPPPLPLGTP